MRALKLCVVLGLVLAVSGTAGAVSVPPLPMPYVFTEMTDHTNGTLYALAGQEQAGTFVWDAGDSRWEPEGDDRAADLYIAPAEGAVSGEDSWGVFALKILRPGTPEYNDNGTPADPTDDYVESMASKLGGAATYQWTQAPGAAGTGLVGIYYGGQDVEVLIRADGSFLVHVENVQFDFYAVDSTLLGADWDGTVGSTGDYTVGADHEGPVWDPTNEPGRRTSQNTYENWVDIDDGTKVPLLHGVSEYFVGDGQLVGSYFLGGNLTYIDIDDGGKAPGYWQWNDLIEDQGPGGTGLFTDPEGNDADIWLDLDLKADTGYEWLSKSNDDGGFGAVPEPLTMAGIFAGCLGLAGYARKRRRA